ncbi:MAG: hypothetical protein JWP91_3043 [Fibrobacteres bacterium]|nr:hypothetical protein [Fibrobacterota bacterium]
MKTDAPVGMIAFRLPRKKLLPWILLGSVISILSVGCDKGKRESIHMKAKSVASPAIRYGSGKIEVGLRLGKGRTDFSAQEDINLVFSVRNHGTKAGPYPVFPGHKATWILKNKSTGSERIEEYRPKALSDLPWMGIPGDREDTLPASETRSFSLRIQDYLGDLEQGGYALKYRLDSATEAFESPWLDFSVSGSSIRDYAAVPSNPGVSKFLRIAWRDAGSNPPRILYHRKETDRNRINPSTTVVVGNCGPESDPVPATTHAGRDYPPDAIAWISGDSLLLARIDDHGTVHTSSMPMPSTTPAKIVPFLIVPGNDNGDSTLAGAILSQDDKGPVIHGFVISGKSGIRWTSPSRLAGLAPQAIRLIPVDQTHCLLLWATPEGWSLRIRTLSWSLEGDFGLPAEIAIIPRSPSDWLAMDVKIEGAALQWGALTRYHGPRDAKGGLDLWTGKVPDMAAMASPQDKPFRSLIQVRENLLDADLRFDAEGIPWTLQHDTAGYWIHSDHGWESPTLIAGSRESGLGRLYFRKGSAPIFIARHPKRGIEVKAVSYPSGLEAVPERVEDNE